MQKWVQQHHKSRKWIVVTTINPPNKAMQSLIEMIDADWSIVIVGDEKTPSEWEKARVHFLSLNRQHELFPNFAALAPVGHYSRKNLGYLYAICHGAECILETDDDNWPYTSFGCNLSPIVEGRLVGGKDWINIYHYFSSENIWPRGLPLDAIYNQGKEIVERVRRECVIQQFLVDADPDVDAIFRLVFNGRCVDFDRNAYPVILQNGTWSPFNSQNTLFYKHAFPILYLPHFVSFRMTDIWRSFVAQAALWPHGHRLAFHTSTGSQIRNAHNLLKDFEQEIPGYLTNRKIADELSAEVARFDSVEKDTVATTAHQLWQHMIKIGVVPEEERPLIDAWFSFIEAAMNQS